MSLSSKIDINDINKLAMKAGELIMQYYSHNEIIMKRKVDGSPVTEADIASSDLIIKSLQKLTPNIQVVSEEMPLEINLNIIKSAKLFWLIDPIDGTWSFIRKNGIFTVNIALIENGVPILGVIYSPLESINYYSDFNNDAFKAKDKKITQIQSNKIFTNGYDFLVSDQNLNQHIQDFINCYPIKTITPIPSSIKFALIADSKGDIYPRFKPTSIWDTAAGHAILKAAGGEVYNLNSLPLIYNQQIDNPNFVAIASKKIELIAKGA